MHDGPVFMVTEVWVKPETLPLLKAYRRTMNKLLEPLRPEYIFSSHAMVWLYGSEGEVLPSGTEVVRFKNEQDAQAAKELVDNDDLKNLESQIFDRVRCYLSRHTAPDELYT